MTAGNLHSIAFDHAWCEQDINDPWCSPRGEITCHATPEATPRAECRWFCDGCDAFYQCDGDCDYCHPDAPAPLTKPHCRSGHLSVWHDYCNPQLWIDDEGILDTGPETRPWRGWRDGPIEFEWTGDSYVWSYA